MEQENRVKRDFLKYAKTPTPWDWIETAEQEEVGKFADLFKAVVNDAKIVLPKNYQLPKDYFVALFPAQFLWGEENTYRSGITNNRVYEVKNGFLGTGYFCITTRHLFIKVLSNLRHKYPVKEEGFLGDFLGQVGGVKDHRKHSDIDQAWEVPLNKISSLQISSSDLEPIVGKSLVVNAPDFKMHMFLGNHELMSWAKLAIEMTKSKKLPKVVEKPAKKKKVLAKLKKSKAKKPKPKPAKKKPSKRKGQA